MPELVLTRATDGRSYTFALKDENGANRDITDQQIRVIMSDHWNRKVYFNGIADHITELPAVVKISPDDTEVPAEGFYDVYVRIEELDIADVVVYAEPYKVFNGLVQGAPTMVEPGP